MRKIMLRANLSIFWCANFWVSQLGGVGPKHFSSSRHSQSEKKRSQVTISNHTTLQETCPIL